MPVTLQPHFEKITTAKHRLTKEDVKRLPAEIFDPVAVFQSRGEENAVLVLTNLVAEGEGPVVVAIHTGDYQHRIASAYGKSPGVIVQHMVGETLYVNKEKARQWSRFNRVQFPKVANHAGQKGQILTSDDLVKDVDSGSGAFSLGRMPSPDGAAQSDATPPGGPIEAEALALRAKESILSSHADAALFPGEIPPETLDAATNLLKGVPSASLGQSRREWREAESREQHAALKAASRARALPGQFVASEGEHRVHENVAAGLVFKATNNERYGLVLDQDEWADSRKLVTRPALPSEYLWRLGLQNVLFEDSIHLTGIGTGSYGFPEIHTSQPLLVGTAPGMDGVRQWMEDAGFRQLPMGVLGRGIASVLSWYRASDEILVYDTKPSNFVQNKDGAIDPIDLVISVFPRALMAETARLNGVEWKKIAGENEPPPAPSSGATLSLSSPELMEMIAAALEKRSGKPPRERTKVWAAAARELYGRARSMRHNDLLGKPTSATEQRRALEAYEAILMALPAEVRGKVGGFVHLAGLTTNKAREAYLRDRIEKASAELEKHLRKEFRADLESFFAKARPDNESGEKARGKLGAYAHRWFARAEAIAALAPSEVDRAAAGWRAILEQGDVSEDLMNELRGRWGEEIVTDLDSALDQVQEEMVLAETIGEALWGTVEGANATRNPMTASELEAAVKMAEHVYEHHRLERLTELARRREDVRNFREGTLLPPLGGLPTPDEVLNGKDDPKLSERQQRVRIPCP